ncbi:GPW/gp25 family protein [Buttiauxella ferragutiae]|uniref:GPW/gp25 family protein n=1 Tax=Buttiauxella ferragutiae TaxID=82989 RepID=UPI00352531C2
MSAPVSLILRLADNSPLDDRDHYPWVSDTREILIAELKMLFTSRTRIPDIEDIPLVNASVLNYGFDESFSRVNEASVRHLAMEQKIKRTISRFEPRLSEVSVSSRTGSSEFILFTLRAYYLGAHVILDMKWNDDTGRFYFDE